MNRSALELPCTLLLGVVAGCAIGRPPWWGNGADAGGGPVSGAVMQRGPGAGQDTGLAGSGGETRSRNTGGKPSRERLEMLAGKFLNRGGVEGMAARMSLIMEIAELSPEEFGPLMELLAKGKTNVEVMDSLIIRWGMVDPKAALAFAIGHEGPDDSDVMTALVLELAKVDLPGAKTAVRQMAGKEIPDVGRQLTWMIMEKDVRAALAYARELKDEEGEVEVLKRMAEDDPLGAAAELTPGREGNLLVVGRIAVALLKKDRAAFEAWAGSLEDPRERTAARFRAIALDAENDPKGAAQAVTAWVAKEPEAAVHDGFLPEWIIKRWMDGGAPAFEVAAWAAALPAGPLREWAISETGSLWQDTMAASAWVSSLPGGVGRDNAVRSLVLRISDESPADALEWACTMGNPSVRYDTLTSILQGWAEKDSAAAQAAVETLPAGDRGYLLEVLQEREKAKATGQK